MSSDVRIYGPYGTPHIMYYFFFHYRRRRRSLRQVYVSTSGFFSLSVRRHFARSFFSRPDQRAPINYYYYCYIARRHNAAAPVRRSYAASRTLIYSGVYIIFVHVIFRLDRCTVLPRCRRAAFAEAVAILSRNIGEIYVGVR